VIVGLRTNGQAAQVAELTGGARLPGKPRKDGVVPLSRLVDVGPDFEVHRAAVESVSLLFKLHDGDAASCAATGEPGRAVPAGWTVTAAKFEVEWPGGPEAAGLIRGHFGARRFAYNCGLAQVKADLDARKQDPGHPSVSWDLASLRKWWNGAKGDLAPWWAENSKEAYACGLADLATALGNWRSSRDGERKGKKAGFPRFKTKRKDRGRVRFTTGAMRLEADRRTVTVPVIGALRSKESTRRVQRHLASGRARILSMTLSERWGRLHVSVSYVVRTQARPPVSRPDARAGVDLGLRVLATVSALDPVTGQETLTEYPNPAPLRQALNARRAAGRQMSRRIPGSRGHRQAKASLARMDRRAVHLRQEAACQLTTELAGTYGEIVIEDLDIAAMKKSMGRRAFRRSVSDAALGRIRPMLDYKTDRAGTTLTVANRWFPSSQIHHGHVLPDGTLCRLAGKHRLGKHLACPETGQIVDRDHNAARNLRDWPDMPVGVQLAPRPLPSAVPAAAPETKAQTPGPPEACEADVRPLPAREEAVRSEARTNAVTQATAEELRKERA
jgi:putative transposase